MWWLTESLASKSSRFLFCHFVFLLPQYLSLPTQNTKWLSASPSRLVCREVGATFSAGTSAFPWKNSIGFSIYLSRRRAFFWTCAVSILAVLVKTLQIGLFFKQPYRHLMLFLWATCCPWHRVGDPCSVWIHFKNHLMRALPFFTEVFPCLGVYMAIFYCNILVVCAIGGEWQLLPLHFMCWIFFYNIYITWADSECRGSGRWWGFLNIEISAADVCCCFFVASFIFLKRSPTAITLLHLVYSLSPLLPPCYHTPTQPCSPFCPLPPILPSSTLLPTLKSLGTACAALRSNGSVCCHFSDAQCEIKRAVYVKSRGGNQTAGLTSGDASDFNHFKLIYMFLLFTSLSAALSQFSSQSLGIFKKKSDFFLSHMWS